MACGQVVYGVCTGCAAEQTVVTVTRNSGQSQCEREETPHWALGAIPTSERTWNKDTTRGVISTPQALNF